DPPCVSVRDVGLRDIENLGTDARADDGDTEDACNLGQLVLVIDSVQVRALVVEVREVVRGGFAVVIKEVGCSEQVVADGQPVAAPHVRRRPHVRVDGQPATVRTTPALTACRGATDTVERSDPRRVSVSDVGLRDIEKSGTGATPQDANLKDPMKVLQLKLPFD